MVFSLSKMRASSTKLSHFTIYPIFLFGDSINFLYCDGAPSQKNLKIAKFRPLPYILKNGKEQSQTVTFTVLFFSLNS